MMSFFYLLKNLQKHKDKAEQMCMMGIIGITSPILI
jgi:hypothetical protein